MAGPTSGAARSIGFLKALAAILFLLTASLPAAEPWQESLAEMPVPARAFRIYKTEPAKVLFDAFRSNAIVKALIFLPAATDQLYFFDRGFVTPPKKANVLTVLEKISERSPLQFTFRSPFLLIHAPEDVLRQVSRLEISGTFAEHFRVIDRDWESLQPLLARTIPGTFNPSPSSPSAWHFYRAYFAGWHLSSVELLQATTLATKTIVTVSASGAIDFNLLEKP
jgi:hypothetical protein